MQLIKVPSCEHCKVPGDGVGSYRKYYIMEKRRFATWKSPAKIAEWYTEGVKMREEMIEALRKHVKDILKNIN